MTLLLFLENCATYRRFSAGDENMIKVLIVVYTAGCFIASLFLMHRYDRFLDTIDEENGLIEKNRNINEKKKK